MQDMLFGFWWKALMIFSPTVSTTEGPDFRSSKNRATFFTVKPNSLPPGDRCQNMWKTRIMQKEISHALTDHNAFLDWVQLCWFVLDGPFNRQKQIIKSLQNVSYFLFLVVKTIFQSWLRDINTLKMSQFTLYILH